MKTTPSSLARAADTHPDSAEPARVITVTNTHLARDTEAARRAVCARARCWVFLDEYAPHEILACPPVRQVITRYAAMEQRSQAQAQAAARLLLGELVSVLANRRNVLARAALELCSEPGQEIALVQAALLQRTAEVEQALEAARELTQAPDAWAALRDMAWQSKEAADNYAKQRMDREGGL